MNILNVLEPRALSSGSLRNTSWPHAQQKVPKQKNSSSDLKGMHLLSLSGPKTGVHKEGAHEVLGQGAKP